MSGLPSTREIFSVGVWNTAKRRLINKNSTHTKQKKTHTMFSSSPSPDDDPLSLALEVIPHRLYFTSLSYHPPSAIKLRLCLSAPTYALPSRSSSSVGNSSSSSRDQDVCFVTVDDDLPSLYQSFFADFGPLDIRVVIRFCRALLDVIVAQDGAVGGAGKSQHQQQRHLGTSRRTMAAGKKYVFYTNYDPHRRTNMACLLGCFAVLCAIPPTPTSSLTTHQPTTIHHPINGSSSDRLVSSSSLFQHNNHLDIDTLCDAFHSRVYPQLLPFRDAAYGPSTFNLHVRDVLRGLYKARVLGWLPPGDPLAVDCEELMAGSGNTCGADWGWIVPYRVCALASPVDADPQRSVDQVLPVLRRHNVRLVVALNDDALYAKRKILQNGIRHLELTFPDGSTPTDTVVRTFLSQCEQLPSGVAVAVHCKAGLGRTGTVIGAFVMKHYGLSAREYIGWARLCRPGVVVGPQQDYLVSMERRLGREGLVYRRARRTESLRDSGSNHHHHLLPALKSTQSGTPSQMASTPNTSAGGGGGGAQQRHAPSVTAITRKPVRITNHHKVPRVAFIGGDGSLPFTEPSDLADAQRRALALLTTQS